MIYLIFKSPSILLKVLIIASSLYTFGIGIISVVVLIVGTIAILADIVDIVNESGCTLDRSNFLSKAQAREDACQKLHDTQ